ncbi:MAG: hypothetical protein WEC75_08170 [Dehalococcoidia bacterium]
MLSPEARGRTVTRAAYAVGVLVALAFAISLTSGGIDYAIRGCGCDEPLFPDWVWVVPLVVAAPFYAAAVALGRRALRRG